MLQESIAVQGTLNLIKDATKALMILAPILGGLLVGFFFMKKGAAETQEQSTWQKRIWVAIYSTVGVLLSSVIINVVVGYYQ